ncbi:arginase family protein [Microbacterium sp.]|uniref:arginase family protein n=1 Tax=Microbacterium sp. TaxID=51671 RepID=UPI002810B177|nr:arginase family protein [Microbacterium sp.]
MTRFLIAPQWQGSPAARAMLLVDGAGAIAGDLPRKDTVALDVPLEAGESLGTGVHRLSSLLRVRELVRDAWQPGTVVIGGDCSVSVFALSALRTLDDLALLWCDAHPDINDPETSPSGAFSGMALRAILGEGEKQLALAPGLPRSRVVMLGARSIDPGESQEVSQLSLIPPAQVEPDAVAAAMRDTGASRAWVHIDVDVLDPAEFDGVSSPLPFGVTAAALTAAIKAVRAEMPLAGATIAGFAPRSPSDAVHDMGTILRLIGAVA